MSVKSIKQRRHQRRRAYRQAKATRTHDKRLVAWRRRKRIVGSKTVKNQELVFDYSVVAPVIFSFVKRPADVIDFLNKLRKICYPKRNVLIDLQHVTTIKHCAMLVLSSNLKENRSFTRGAKIFFRPPQDPTAFRVWTNTKPEEAQSYQNRILGRRRNFHKQVEVKLAELLVHEATNYLTGQTLDHHGAYRTLTECMSNTFKHADPAREATENWWVASYAHPGPGPKRWCFAFVDNGVGILDSLNVKGIFLKIQKLLGLLSNSKILNMLVNGQIGSRLNLSYRGKGLPSIYKELQRGRIENLVIITNDTRANFATEEYVTITQSFPGTFLYWEISSLSLPSQS